MTSSENASTSAPQSGSELDAPLVKFAVVAICSLLLAVVTYSLIDTAASQDDRQVFRVGTMAFLVRMAPVMTVLVAGIVLIKYMLTPEKVACKRYIGRGWSIVTLLVTLLLCLRLGGYRDPIMHLWSVLALFGLFFLWDFIAAPCTQNAELKNEIAEANRLLNRPSIILFVFMIMFIGSRNDSVFPTLRANGGDPEPDTVDYFVAGVICFHLLGSAVTYLIYSTRQLPNNNIFFRIVKWVALGVPGCKH